MKAIKYALLGLVSLLAVDSFAVITAPISNQFDNTGTIVLKDVIDIKVKNGTGSSVAAGKLVVFNSTADDGASISLSSTYGVSTQCVTVGTIADGAEGKCRVWGVHDTVLYSNWGGNVSAGDTLWHSSDALQGYASGKPVAGPHPPVYGTDWPIGVALDAATSTGTIQAFITLLGR